MINRLSLLCSTFLASLFVITGCSAEAAPRVSGEADIPPGYTYARARVACEDRYLFFEGDALVVNGSLYCPAGELAESEALTQAIEYQGVKYAPVRAYYEALGKTVTWDSELGLVRVYENAPEYGSSPSGKRVSVLLYHHILMDGENTKFRGNGSVVSVEAFEDQMKYLSDNGYTPITLLQLHDFLYRNREVPDKSVLITFDDGYYSNFVRAYPILKKYGLTAVIFPITGYLSDTEPGEFNPDKLQYFTADGMRSYADVFEYATHTHVLHGRDSSGDTPLSRADAYTIITDLDYSFEIVNNNIALAYPRGVHNRNLIETLRDTPVKLAFTTKSGPVKSGGDPYKLCRNIVWPDMSLEQFADLLY